MAEVTMSLQEYNDLIAQRDQARREYAELQERMCATASQDSTTGDLLRCIQAAIPIITFAVGNLDPATVRGWPYGHLKTFAEGLEGLPGVDTRTKEYALDLRNFIYEARGIESERARRDEALTAPSTDNVSDQ